MPNPWVLHVKEFSKKNKLSYGCAITNDECKKEYQKKKKMPFSKMMKSIQDDRKTFG